MQALTTDTAQQLAQDIADITAILELLASTKTGITSSSAAAFSSVAAACDEFLAQYRKIF